MISTENQEDELLQKDVERLKEWFQPKPPKGQKASVDHRLSLVKCANCGHFKKNHDLGTCWNLSDIDVICECIGFVPTGKV